jgi:hypothetical protein
MERMKQTIIGSTILMDIIGIAKDVPAKVDTGADSSAIWASNIFVDDKGVLHYELFGVTSAFYTGIEYKTKHFTVASILSSTGHKEIRYRVKLPTRIGGRLVNAQFNLSNRSKQKFPVLIGRRTLNKKFVVDVAKRDVTIETDKTRELNKEMKKDPYAFYKKYHQ